jgi:hypothetical protein
MGRPIFVFESVWFGLFGSAYGHDFDDHSFMSRGDPRGNLDPIFFCLSLPLARCLPISSQQPKGPRRMAAAGGRNSSSISSRSPWVPHRRALAAGFETAVPELDLGSGRWRFLQLKASSRSGRRPRRGRRGRGRRGGRSPGMGTPGRWPWKAASRELGSSRQRTRPATGRGHRRSPAARAARGLTTSSGASEWLESEKKRKEEKRKLKC